MPKKRDRYEHITLAVSIIGVVLVVITTILSQINVASSNRDTASALQKLASLAESAHEQAVAANKQAIAANDQAKVLESTLAVDRNSVDVARTSFQSSQEIAERQTRPYLRIVADPLPIIEAGKPISARYNVSNGSQYPAFDVRVAGWTTATFQKPLQTLSAFALVKNFTTIGTLQPGLNNLATYENGPNLTPQNVTDLKTPGVIIYGLVMVTYQDGRQKPHNSYMCASFVVKTDRSLEGHPCEAPNDD